VLVSRSFGENSGSPETCQRADTTTRGAIRPLPDAEGARFFWLPGHLALAFAASNILAIAGSVVGAAFAMAFMVSIARVPATFRASTSPVSHRALASVAVAARSRIAASSPSGAKELSAIARDS